MPVPVNQAMINYIAGDDYWEQSNISFSIGLGAGGAHGQDDAADDFGEDPDFLFPTEANREAIREAVKLWDDLIDNSITENDVSSAVISVDQVYKLNPSESGVTFGTLHESISGPDNEGVYLSSDDIKVGTYDFTTVVHEFGHALGLSHPGNYNAGAVQPTYAANRMFDEDTGLYSVMSYFEPSNYNPAITWTRSDIRTPMIYDILAIQQLYGADTTTRTGDTTYGFNTKLSDFANALDQSVFSFTATVPGETASSPAVFTIWDAGGDHDRIDASQFNSDQRIDLTPGTYSDIGEYYKSGAIHTVIDSVGIAFGVTIEEAIGGSGNDTITGNYASNYLDGGAGNDSIDGGYGDDTIIGGAGNDDLHGDLGSDTLTGGDGNDQLFGGFGSDTLVGGKGDDYLDGGGSLDGGGQVFGPDTLTGGAGADTFVYSTHYRTTVITDYNPKEDILDFTNFKSVHSFQDVLAHATEDGTDDTVFDFGDPYTPGGIGDTLRLQHVRIADLDPSLMKFGEETANPVPPGFQSLVNPYNPTQYFGAETAPLADGGFVLLERSLRDFFDGVMLVHRFDSHGIETGTFAVNDTPIVGGDNLSARIVGLVGGGFAVVWEINERSQGGDERDPDSIPVPEIHARFYDADGNPVSGDVKVNQSPPVVQYQKHTDYELDGTHYYYTYGYNFDLQFAGATTSGGLSVEWSSGFSADFENNVDTRIVRQVFDRYGNYAGGEVVVGSLNNNHGDPILAYDPYGDTYADGRFITLSNGDVLRLSTVPNASGTYVDLTAEIVGKTGPVNLTQGGNGYVFTRHYATVTELADGRIEISWTSGGPFSNYSNFSTGVDTVIFDDHTLIGFTKPGTDGDDVMRGGPGNDRLYGLGGNDTFIPGLGADILDGGDGNDTVDYSRSLQGVEVNLAVPGRAGIGGHADGDTFVSIENIIGSPYADYLVAGPGPGTIRGGFGKDQLFGGGETILYGDAGDDTLQIVTDASKPLKSEAYGGKGNDTIGIIGDTGSAYGGDDDDTITATGDGSLLDGGDGADTITATGSNNQLYGDDGGDTLVVFGDGNKLYGGSGYNVLQVTGDNNVLQGGDDGNRMRVFSGTGNTLIGGAGDDRLFGGAGVELIDAGSDGVDEIDGGGGIDSLTLNRSGATANLKFVMTGFDSVTTLVHDGTTVVNVENIDITGGSGADTFTTWSGNDALRGGEGADTLAGGKGDDMLEGDGGADKFIYLAGDGHDTIVDFNPTDGDTIDLTGAPDVTSYLVLLGMAQQVGGDVVIFFADGGTLTLRSFSLGALRASAFGLPDPGPLAVSDTAANIAARLDALSAYGNITSITLTDAGTPELDITDVQAAADASVLAKITNVDYTIVITSPDQREVRTFDAAGHVSLIYDSTNALFQKKIFDTAGTLRDQYFYDANGLVVEEEHNGSDGALLTSRSYYPGSTQVSYSIDNTHPGTLTDGRSYAGLGTHYAMDGTVLNTTYFASNGLTLEIDYFDPSTGIREVDLFDAAGQVVSIRVTQADGTSREETYASDGGYTETNFDSSGYPTDVTVYNNVGNVIKLSVYFAGTSQLQYFTDFTANGTVHGASYYGETLQYAADGRVLLDQKYGNGLPVYVYALDLMTGTTTTRYYNDDLNPTELDTNYTDGARAIRLYSATGSVETGYNAAGAQISQKTYDANGVLLKTRTFGTDGKLLPVTHFDASGDVASSTTYFPGTTQIMELIQNGITGRSYNALDYVYDASGRLVHQTLFAGAHIVVSDVTVTGSGPTQTTTTKLYDAAGNPISTTMLLASGAHDVRTYTASGSTDIGYDAQNHLISQTVYDTAGTLRDQYTFDAAGRLTGVFHYDATGHLVSSQTYYAGSTQIKDKVNNNVTGTTDNGVAYAAWHFTYAADGTPTGRTYFANNGSVIQSYAADPLTGAHDIRTYTATGSTDIGYDAQNHQISQTVYDTAGTLRDQYTYDAAGRLTGVFHYDATSHLVSSQTYYAGSTQIRDKVNNNVTGTVANGQAYTSLHYTYAADGTLTGQTFTNGAGHVVETYALNQTAGTKVTSFFDASGAPTSTTTGLASGAHDVLTYTASGSTDIGYDVQNHQIAQKIYNTAGVLTDDYEYDGAGHYTSIAHYNATGTLTSNSTFYAGTSNYLTIDNFGVTGQTYNAQHRVYDAGNVLATQTLDQNDGSFSKLGYGDNRTLTSTTNAADTLQATGASETFVFHANFGHDTVTSFIGAGATHDVVQFDAAAIPGADDTARANYVLAHSTAASATSVQITLDPANTITLKGVSLATLQANTQDFRFA